MTAGQQTRIERCFEMRPDPQHTPQPVDGEAGLFVVDATWGTISPIRLHPEIETVGEPELIEHLAQGGRAIDTRKDEFVAEGTIPGAEAIPRDEVADRVGELGANADAPIAFFCNGPQCSATPKAVGALLDAGFPPHRILYYRGGIHDWVTLGLPLARPRA